jgi:hypothetical protein
VVVKIKKVPTEEGGLGGPIKSNPHSKNGNSGRIGCNGMVERHSFLENFWLLSRDLEKT